MNTINIIKSSNTIRKIYLQYMSQKAYFLIISVCLQVSMEKMNNSIENQAKDMNTQLRIKFKC